MKGGGDGVLMEIDSPPDEPSEKFWNLKQTSSEPVTPNLAKQGPQQAPKAPTLAPKAPTLLPKDPTLAPKAPTLLPKDHPKELKPGPKKILPITLVDTNMEDNLDDEILRLLKN